MSRREFTIKNEYRYNQSGALPWIISHCNRYRLHLSGFLLGVIISAGLNALIPRLIGNAFNIVLEEDGTLQMLLPLVMGVITAVLLRGLSDMLGQFSMEVVSKRLERDSRDELYLNLLGKSQTFHNRQRVGDIMARAANDVREINFMMMPGLSLIVDSSMGVIMPILFIATIRLQLLAAPLLFTAAYILALRRYTRQLNPVAAAMRQSFGQMNAGLAEVMTGIEVVKSSVQEQQELNRFSKNARNFRDNFVREGQIQARYLPPLLLGFALAGAFAHGLLLLTRGQITIGDLVAYMGLMGLLRYPAFISIFTFSLVQLGLASAERILALMREETEIDENEQGYQAQMQGEIVFENVTFGYGTRPVLQNISFRAAPGQTVAIVGQTGSGKSTLTSLVNRTYDVQPQNGRILIDGHNVQSWQLAALRFQISTIEQDIFLFSRSVAENIGFGVGPAIDRNAIEQAAKEAQADEFIQQFSDGYDTVIGERGATLSGGQRQRLAIARALLTDPRILILDDATSAIDSATEDKIQRAIGRILEGRTTLLITHRLSQIRRADKILVLRQGEIIDQGTHSQLIGRCTLYQRIFGIRKTASQHETAADNLATTGKPV